MTDVDGPNLHAEVPEGWEETAFEKYVSPAESESRWQQPGAEGSYLLIDVHSPTHLSAEADAAPVHASVARQAGYSELGYQATTLGTTPAWEWNFEVEGRERVAYYFEACGHVYGVLGSAIPAAFSGVSSSFSRAAQSIAATCSNEGG